MYWYLFWFGIGGGLLSNFFEIEVFSVIGLYEIYFFCIDGVEMCFGIDVVEVIDWIEGYVIVIEYKKCLVFVVELW